MPLAITMAITLLLNYDHNPGGPKAGTGGKGVLSATGLESPAQQAAVATIYQARLLLHLCVKQISVGQ